MSGIPPHYLPRDDIGVVTHRRAGHHHLERSLFDMGGELEGIGDHSNVEPQSLGLCFVDGVGGSDVSHPTSEHGMDGSLAVLHLVLH